MMKKAISFILIIFIFLSIVFIFPSRPAYSQLSIPKLEKFERNRILENYLESNIPEPDDWCTSLILERSEQLHDVNLQILQQQYSLKEENNYKINQPEDCYLLYKYRLRVNNLLKFNDND